MTVKTRIMPPLVRETIQLDPNILYLTYAELEEILYNNNTERFVTTFDSIPLPEPGETDYNVNNYIEDDGRQMRTVEFTDKLTNKEYSFCYVWSSEWGYDFPNTMFNSPDGVEFVDESVLAKKTFGNIKRKERIAHSEKAKKAKQMMRLYNRMNLIKEFDFKTTDIPDERLKSLVDSWNAMKDQKFGIYDLQLLLIPTCIEYKIGNAKLWAWVQTKKTFKVRKNKSAKKSVDSKAITALSQQLIDSLIERYYITSYDDFTCPIIRDIAKELKVFG